MITACYAERTRTFTRAIQLIVAVAEGCRGKLVLDGRFDFEADDHAVMSTWPTTQRVVAECRARSAPFWHLDSCWMPTRNGDRYYRVTRNGCRPTIKPDCSLTRAFRMGIRLAPWRKTGEHILICRQGPSAGKQWGTDPNAWNDAAAAALTTMTDRPIRIREKVERKVRDLAADLDGAWAVVTHSSTSAVAAAIAGIPVFCSADNAAAAVGCDDLSRIESPVMPDRLQWLAALGWGQFTMDELRAGLWMR